MMSALSVARRGIGPMSVVTLAVAAVTEALEGQASAAEVHLDLMMTAEGTVSLY